MNEWLYAVGVGFIFALGGLMCFGILIGIGQIIEWYEKRYK